MNEVDSVKSATEIVEIVSRYVQLERKGYDFVGLCPFHNDHSPSLRVSPDRNAYKCFSCGVGGDVFDFVQEIEGLSFPEALQDLAEAAGITLQQAEQKAPSSGPQKNELLSVLSWANDTFQHQFSLGGEAANYVRERKITEESVIRFRIGYNPIGREWLYERAKRDGFPPELLEAAGLLMKLDNGTWYNRFRGRLMFPVSDIRGRVIGFSGRVLPSLEADAKAHGREGKIAKYINSPATAVFNKSKTIYAIDLAREQSRYRGSVIVVEGQGDVIAMHQHGFRNCVATLGTALTDQHVAAIKRIAPKAVLVYDGDEAGAKAGDRALPLFLAHEIDLSLVILPPDQDPDTILRTSGSLAMEERLSHQLSPIDYVFRRKLDNRAADIDNAEWARKTAESILTIIAMVPATVRSGLELKVSHALGTLSRQTSIPVTALVSRLRQLRERSKAYPPWESVGPSVDLLDAVEAEFIRACLSVPGFVGKVRFSVPLQLFDSPDLRAIFEACCDAYAAREPTTFEGMSRRLGDAQRKVAATLSESGDYSANRIAEILYRIDIKRWQWEIRQIDEAIKEGGPREEIAALKSERNRLLDAKPATPQLIWDDDDV